MRGGDASGNGPKSVGNGILIGEKFDVMILPNQRWGVEMLYEGITVGI